MTEYHCNRCHLRTQGESFNGMCLDCRIEEDKKRELADTAIIPLNEEPCQIGDSGYEGLKVQVDGPVKNGMSAVPIKLDPAKWVWQSTGEELTPEVLKQIGDGIKAVGELIQEPTSFRYQTARPNVSHPPKPVPDEGCVIRTPNVKGEMSQYTMPEELASQLRVSASEQCDYQYSFQAKPRDEDWMKAKIEETIMESCYKPYVLDSEQAEAILLGRRPFPRNPLWVTEKAKDNRLHKIIPKYDFSNFDYRDWVLSINAHLPREKAALLMQDVDNRYLQSIQKKTDTGKAVAVPPPHPLIKPNLAKALDGYGYLLTIFDKSVTDMMLQGSIPIPSDPFWVSEQSPTKESCSLCFSEPTQYLDFRYRDARLWYNTHLERDHLTRLMQYIDQEYVKAIQDRVDVSRKKAFDNSIRPSAVLNMSKESSNLPQEEVDRIVKDFEQCFMGNNTSTHLLVAPPGGTMEPWVVEPMPMRFFELTEPVPASVLDRFYTELVETKPGDNVILPLGIRLRSTGTKYCYREKFEDREIEIGFHTHQELLDYIKKLKEEK